jgi:hypothetical protein
MVGEKTPQARLSAFPAWRIAQSKHSIPCAKGVFNGEQYIPYEVHISLHKILNPSAQY